MTFASYVGFLLEKIASLGNALVALAIVILLFGVFKYSLSSGTNPESRKNLGTFLMYGLLAILVMVAFWGILNFLFSSVRIG